VSQLLVTAYNLGFGDTLLVTIPERQRGRETDRHVLIDFGNVLGKFDEESRIFGEVAEDIRRRLDGRPIDLYIMTHEHMDHVRGLTYASSLNIPLPIAYCWLTASSDPRYGLRYPRAEKRLALYREEYQRVQLAIAAQGLTPAEPLQAFLAINDFNRTASCVDFIREAAAKKSSYIHRESRLVPGRNHPLREAQISIWGPEADTTVYYTRFRPVAAQAIQTLTGQPPSLEAPEGIDPIGFGKLIDFLKSGFSDNLLAIDRAANNTSIVFLLEWRGWKLLFPGDADLRSWAFMERLGLLQPVHFLKVSHHASRNGTPPEELLEKLLPAVRTDARPRTALVSTSPGVYNGVPDPQTQDRIRTRVDQVVDTRDAGLGHCVEVAFEG